MWSGWNTQTMFSNCELLLLISQPPESFETVPPPSGGQTGKSPSDHNFLSFAHWAGADFSSQGCLRTPDLSIFPQPLCFHWRTFFIPHMEHRAFCFRSPTGSLHPDRQKPVISRRGGENDTWWKGEMRLFNQSIVKVERVPIGCCLSLNPFSQFWVQGTNCLSPWRETQKLLNLECEWKPHEEDLKCAQATLVPRCGFRFEVGPGCEFHKGKALLCTGFTNSGPRVTSGPISCFCK